MIYRLTIDCFHATPEVEEAFEQFRQMPVFGKSRINLRPGGLTAAVDFYHENATPQLVVVEETGDDAAMLERLGQLAEVCVAGTRVVVVGQLNDIALYRNLLSQGVSEYLMSPLSGEKVGNAIEALFADPTATPRGRMIAFIGARGGVGSSTLAHNTAWNLTQIAGEDVIAVDLDLAFGTLGLAFNIEPRQTVGELLAQSDRMDAQLLDRVLIKYDEHLQLLPAPSQPVNWRSIDVEAVDKLYDLVRQMAGFVVVDLPHQWGPWVSHTLELADDVVIVAQPDLPNLRDAKALLDTVGPRRGDKLPTHLVLNKVDAYKKTQLTAKDFEETLQLKPAFSFPFDPVFGDASNNGQMLAQAAKGNKLVEQMNQLGLLLGNRQAMPSRRPQSGGASLSAWLKKAKLVK